MGEGLTAREMGKTSRGDAGFEAGSAWAREVGRRRERTGGRQASAGSLRGRPGRQEGGSVTAHSRASTRPSQPRSCPPRSGLRRTSSQ